MKELNQKEAAHEVVTAIHCPQGPRRVRRFPARKPLMANGNLKMSATLSDENWSPGELERLSASMATVDPTSELFWYSVSCLVRDRTESECRAKWFSVAKTPIPKLSKKAPVQQNEVDCVGDEDDIFNSSPMRGFPCTNSDKPDSKDTTGFLCHYFGSVVKVKDDACAVVSERLAANPISFRPKAGYKTYLQNLRRDVSRAEKKVPARKPVGKTKGPSAISESIFESDVDVNVRLTPGGTLNVKSQYDDEGDDDFWGDDYDAEDEEAE